MYHEIQKIFKPYFSKPSLNIGHLVFGVRFMLIEKFEISGYADARQMARRASFEAK